MTQKQIHFKDEALTKVLKGADTLVNAMRITLGPKSKSILISKKYGRPIICNDGVTIAKEVEFSDPEENLGALMMREVAEKTGDAVGDGTTTATLLAHAIFSGGLKNITAGASAIELKKGLEKGLGFILEELHKISRPIKDKVEIEQIATISAHSDPVLGKMVADAIDKVGSEGAVTVEESQGTETTVEIVEGLRFDHGYLSSYFVTDTEKMLVELENPYILFLEKKLSNVRAIIPLLETVMKQGKSFLIIADDVDGEALATLVVNKIQGFFKCAAVKSPGFGDQKKAQMEDIAILCGGKFISEEFGMKLENLKIEDLGSASKVIISKDKTTIIAGGGDKKLIQERIAQIKYEASNAKYKLEQEKLQARLAKLSGGVAVIRVGAPSETEIKSKKEALDDSISATKAAVQEGIIPGGGLTLVRLSQKLEALEMQESGDTKTGLNILRKALEVPARQIAKNSNMDDGVAISEMKKNKGTFGLDGSTGEIVDLVKAGIIDPTKVIRTVLENAVSVAGTLLLSEGTLTEVETKEDRRAPELYSA